MPRPLHRVGSSANVTKARDSEMPPIRREDGSTLIVLGPGTIDNVGSELAELGATRVYLVTGPSLASGRVGARVRRAFGGLLVGTYARSRPHVPSETMDEVVREARSLRADVLVGLGGGSPIGTAKAAAFRLQQLGGSGPPVPCIVAAIPTTYSGSEVTPVFGTTDLERHRKSVLRSDLVRPRLALYDPELALDTPPDLSASTGVNALAHCVEAGYARDLNPVVRPVALEGLRHIARSLPLCVAAGDDIEAREDLLLGAYLAGFSIANATMALHHGLCHVLGGRTGIAHGVVNAILLPHVMTFNADAVPDAMSAIADAMDAGARTRDIGAAPRAVAALVATLPVPKRLREAGVSEDMLASLAAEAAANQTIKANPKPVSEADLVQLLRSAW